MYLHNNEISFSINFYNEILPFIVLLLIDAVSDVVK